MKKIFLSFGFIALGVLYGAKVPLVLNPMSLRSMATGDLLYVANKNKNTNWDMKEVPLLGYLAKRFPFGAVQFRHMKDLNKCLMMNDAYVYIGDCLAIHNGDYRTLFSLLPSTSGAVQIQSIASEKCILADEAKPNKKQLLKIDNCHTDRHSPIAIPRLWVIAPAMIESSPVQ